MAIKNHRSSEAGWSAEADQHADLFRIDHNSAPDRPQFRSGSTTIPPELEDYESAMLWKSLHNLCSQLVYETEIHGFAVRVLSPTVRRAEAANELA